MILASAEATGMEAITTGVSSLMTMAGTMLTFVTGNPVLCAIFASGFVGIAVGIIRKFRK